MHNTTSIRLHFSELSEGKYSGTSSSLQSGAFTILVVFDAQTYPLDRHYRYVHHREPSLPYTFSNMDFVQDHPGLRVGPWPGWRDIPSMPKTKLSIGNREYSGRFDFWGDELSQQHVRCVFECVIADEKELILHVDDSRLIPLYANVYESRINRAHAISISLRSELINQYPRLLFTNNEIESFKRKAQSSQKRLWNRIISLLDNWNLPAHKTTESKVVDNIERLFPEDRVVVSSFVALIEPMQSNKARAVQSLIDYAELTAQPDYEPLKIDTQSGEVLFVLCLGYDWCYDFLATELKEKVKKRIWEVADVCWSYLGYERRDYAQAHFLGCGMGLLAFSFLFWNEHLRAKEWVNYLRGTLDVVLQMLPDDGFYPHGINLWIYEHGFLLRWLELFRHCANEDLWSRTSYFKNVSVFRSASTTDDGLYGITFGDPQYRVAGDSWCHYLIASRTKSQEAQWLGNFLSDSPIENVDYRSVPSRRRVYEFLFYDEKISSQKIDESIICFHDGGQIFIRNNNPTKSSLFTFRAGPPLGWKRYCAGERGGYGHSEPSNGSFLVYMKNDFVLSGPGPTYRRDTSLHNTITIDDQGQIGDSTVWVPDFFPQECIPDSPEFIPLENGVTLKADLTRSYLPHLGVKSCIRNMFIDLENNIVGVDHVELSEERNIQWNIHSWGEFLNQHDEEFLHFEIKTKNDFYPLYILQPPQCEWKTGLTEMVPAYPHDGKRDNFLNVTKKSKHITFIWCFVLQNHLRPQIHLQNESNFQINFEKDKTICFDGTQFEIRK